ncbi:DUF354 domain-containing protein [Patescibacteria group bacterium]
MHQSSQISKEVKLNILVDVGHPAHVHLFKYFIKYLKEKGHRVIVTSRDKDITLELLEKYGIENICISRSKKNIILKLLELVVRDIRTFHLHFKNKFDFSFGTSINITHLTAIFGVPSYVFSESDDSAIKLHTILAYPFATNIIIPKSIKYEKWKNKRVIHNSSHKLAYLHPNHFKPNPKVLEKYNLRENEFVIMRKSALAAHHDINARGVDDSLWQKIKDLLAKYQIVDSVEGFKSLKIDATDMHDLLYFAKMLIGDSQSMSMEAAFLGTPCVRISTFGGKLNAIEELENNYALLYSYHPDDESSILKRIKSLLRDKALENKFAERRKRMLDVMDDFTDWMIVFFEKEVQP